MLPNPLETGGAEESKGPNEGAEAAAAAAAAAACPSTSSSAEPVNESVRAVWELYTHLCHGKSHSSFHRDFLDSSWLICNIFFCENLCSDSISDACVSVVDGPEGETSVEKALRKEAVKAILNGAAVFFPDKHIRRDKLFNMMVSALIF